MSNKVAHGKEIVDMDYMIDLFLLEEEEINKLLKRKKIKSTQNGAEYIVHLEDALEYYNDHLHEIAIREVEIEEYISKLDLDHLDVDGMTEYLDLEKEKVCKLMSSGKIKTKEVDGQCKVFWEEAVRFMTNYLNKFSHIEFEKYIENLLNENK